MTDSSVKVFVRIRKGKSSNQNMIYSNKSIQLNTTQSNKRIFNFEGIFNPNVSQSELYARAIASHVEDALAGYNCTVLVYGQTATGKTYTMEGILSSEISTQCQNGIIPRSFIHIMQSVNSVSYTTYISISFYEIYNEEIIDLIGSNNSNLKLLIYENVKGEYTIKNLTKIKVHNCNELLTYLIEGTKKRQKLSTLLNKSSSRSHTIFTIRIKRKDVASGLCTNGKINFIDLAGSENVCKSGITKKNFQETSNINKSLLTLGRVIKGLSNKDKHIPYRESNLTRILKNSLNGNTKTIMIATVTTDPKNADETFKTLEYASNAQMIVNKIYHNAQMENKSITKMCIIQDMRVKIEELKKSLGEVNAKNLESILENNSIEQKELFIMEKNCETVEENVTSPLEAENKNLNDELEKLRKIKSNLVVIDKELKQKIHPLTDFLLNAHNSLTQSGEKKELISNTLKNDIIELLKLKNYQLNILKANEEQLICYEQIKAQKSVLLSKIKESQDMAQRLQRNNYLLMKCFFQEPDILSSKEVLENVKPDELTSLTAEKLKNISENTDNLLNLLQKDKLLASKEVTDIKEKLFNELYDFLKTQNNLANLNFSFDPYDGLLHKGNI